MEPNIRLLCLASFVCFALTRRIKYGRTGGMFSMPAQKTTMASRSRLLAEQRRRKILEFVEQKGQITVRELATRFSVSAVTARGDLDALCAEGLAIRSHGGAVRNLSGSDAGTPSKDSQPSAKLDRLGKVSLG